ncbi:MAG: ABC transporter substrate-binding protein [Acidimicrobiia bacterium]
MLVVASTLTVALIAASGVGASARPGAKKPPKVPGFDGETITLGVVTPLSGLVSVLGKPLTTGNETYWEHVNANGGVAGKYTVKLDEQDSQYQVEAALQGYDKIKDDVVAFQQILGTQITLALLPKLKADKLSAAPATLDAEWVNEAQLFPVGGPYQIQAINAFAYYIKQAGGKGKKICAIAQDDAYGTAGLQGVTYASKKLKFKVAKTVRFASGSDVSAQIGQLADADCQAVWVGATAADANSIITKAISRSFEPQMIAQAPFWLGSFAQTASIQSFLEQHLWLASEGPAWGDTSVPGMAQMLEHQQQYAPNQQPDQYFEFGYAQAWAMDEILKRAVKNGDLSRSGIQKASNQVGTLEFGGLTGDYLYGTSASKRNPPRSSTIFKVNPSEPVGLEVLATVASSAAKSYTFKK